MDERQSFGTIGKDQPTFTSIVLASGAAFFLLLAEHYTFIGLRPPYTYVAGVLALKMPFSAWCAWYRMWWPLVTLWSVTVVGGTAVIGAYTLDWALAANPDWRAGAGLLMTTLVASLVGALALVWHFYRSNQALRSVIALQKGMGHDVGKHQGG